MFIHTLKQALKQADVDLTDHRIDLISRLVCALVQVRSVNLKKLACSLSGAAQIESHYRRLQRFFSSRVSPGIFTQLIVSKLVRPGQSVLLVLDRTHWMLGQTDLNILCLGLVYQGVSIPLEYVSLQKPGNSNTQERKQIMQQALAYLKTCSCTLLADREFIGKAWFCFLLAHRVDFVIRLTGNTWVTLDDGRLRYIASFNQRMPRGQTRFYPHTILYGDVTLNLVCHRPAKGELVILITNRTDLEQILALYGVRWSIETTFTFLKSRGFNLEDTHLIHPERLHLLLGVLAWTLLWVLLIGRHLHQSKPIKIKKHGRRAISLFRLGLDQLTQAIHNAKDRWKEGQLYCQLLLSCT